VTAFLTLRAARSAVLEDVPEGWELQAFEPSLDTDVLSWLGFEPGEPYEHTPSWPRPRHWAAPRRAGGRHRAPARFRTA
jgi:hypothetical protein